MSHLSGLTPASSYLLSSLAVACLAVPLLAQSPNSQFEVASIKPSGVAQVGTIEFPRGGRFRASKITVMNLVTYAFELPEKQVANAPSWLTSDRFDIVAVPANGGDPDTPDNGRQTRVRVQALLAERFAFKFHSITEERSILALFTDKNGPKVQPNSGIAFGMHRQGRRINFEKVTMARFAQALSGPFYSDEIGRPVVDRTGLTGEYDFMLDWAPEVVLPNRVIKSSHDQGGPTIGEALHELGLRLQPEKGPVQILAIDHVEKPSEN